MISEVSEGGERKGWLGKLGKRRGKISLRKIRIHGRPEEERREPFGKPPLPPVKTAQHSAAHSDNSHNESRTASKNAVARRKPEGINGGHSVRSPTEMQVPRADSDAATNPKLG